MGQVPALLNYSDVGTKVLTKGRLFFLLHEVGMMDPKSLGMVGQEEHAIVTEQIRNKEALAKVVCSVKCMSLGLGVQGLEPLAAEAVDPDTCQFSGAPNDSNELFWIWAMMVFMFAAWMMFAVVAYFAWKRLLTDLYHCCNQIADEDYYAAQQAGRIDLLTQRCERLENELEQNIAELSDRVRETSNELSMTHDYVTGLHYSLVEHGGFLQNGLGLSHEQWMHLRTLISSRTTGAVEYMRLVHQRCALEGPADATDENDNGHNGHDGESSESEMEEDADMEEPDTSLASGGAFTLDERVEFLKMRKFSECAHQPFDVISVDSSARMTRTNPMDISVIFTADI
eukprot:s3391_g3.t1